MAVSIKQKLDRLVDLYNTPAFIESDPISIPHQFSNRQDIEIAGLIAAVFAWGQRKTIINKSGDFLSRMDDKPFDFVSNFEPSDLKPFKSFKHRTFNGDDAIGLLYFLQSTYRDQGSLECFFRGREPDAVYSGLCRLHEHFKSHPASLARSLKHISSPSRNSACKRLNMFLRWMVRKDDRGVDFGIWDSINPSELIIPLDVHVIRSAQRAGLINDQKANWKTAIELTSRLAEFDPDDPVRYDYALFNMGLQNL